MGKMVAALMADLGNWMVYLAILALFVVCMAKCVIPVLHSKNLLRRAVRRIKKEDALKRSWQSDDFLGKGALCPHWKEYLNNLFFADGEFHNPSNVEDFINEDTAIYGPGRSQLAEAAPGLMVSLGFLGTLIGMTSGLSGFNMNDSEAVMSSIRTLLPGIRYAFTTSIVGVVASILTTLIVRIVNGGASRALIAFYSAMNEYAGVVSVEPMTQIAIYQQEQTALISQLAQSITSEAAERLGQGIAEAIGKSYRGMQSSLDSFMEFATERQIQGVNAVVDRFMQQMNESMGGQFRSLAITLEETGKNQIRMNDMVRQATEGLGQISGNLLRSAQAAGELGDQLKGYLRTLNENALAAQGGYERIAATVEHLEIVARQFNGYLQQVNALESRMGAENARLDKSRKELLDSFARTGRDLTDGVAGAAEAMKGSAALLANSHEALAEGISRDIDKTYNDFFANTHELMNQVVWTLDELKHSTGELSHILQGVGDMHMRQGRQMDEALTALNEAVEGLGRALSPGR